MTPRRERPGAFDDPSLPRQFGHQMRWNKIAELMQEREAAARWLVRCGFIHPLPCGRFTRGKPTLFYPSTLNPVGLLWVKMNKTDRRRAFITRKKDFLAQAQEGNRGQTAHFLCGIMAQDKA